MFASQLVVDVPEMTEVPAWVYVVACVVAWYVVWGVVIRLWFGSEPKYWYEVEDWRVSRAVSWVLCPLIIPVAATWSLIALLSFGIVPPPWKVIRRPSNG
jgi:hypothetical protein